MSSHRVPGGIPSSGHPSASSYVKPQARQRQVLYGTAAAVAEGMGERGIVFE
jgi:hypothetical protein